jgi:hypothetical protein
MTIASDKVEIRPVTEPAMQIWHALERPAGVCWPRALTRFKKRFRVTANRFLQQLDSREVNNRGRKADGYRN